MKVTFVDQTSQIKDLVDEVMSLSSPGLFLDAEGIELGRQGEMVFLQMYIDTDAGRHTYVIDVWALKTEATFHTPGTANPKTTFKAILENPLIPKLFWDCRMDSEALYHQHGISLAGVLDVQLIEVAQRRPGRPLCYIRGYGECCIYDLHWLDTSKMSSTKDAKRLFIPRFGGSWDVLTTRPLEPAILDYCARDVKYMRILFKVYSRMLLSKDRPCINPGVNDKYTLEKPADYFGDHGYKWTRKVVEESAKRVARAQGEGWDREVDHMTSSPWPDELLPSTYYYC